MVDFPKIRQIQPAKYQSTVSISLTVLVRPLQPKYFNTTTSLIWSEYLNEFMTLVSMENRNGTIIMTYTLSEI